MSSTVLCGVILFVCTSAYSAAQASCKGRCGGEYYRGFACQCDFTCLTYGECCKDFESQCTTKNSCKGRCGESFKRGRLCSCDSDCSNYKQCCSDHKLYCDAEEPTVNEATEPSTFSEGDNADMDSQLFPNDEFINNEVEDPEESPILESTSGYGSSTADPLDHIPTEPIKDPDALELATETFTVFPQTQTTISDTKPTQADDDLSTLYPTIEEAPTESTIAIDPTSASDPGTALPQPTTAANHVSSRHISTSVPQTEYSPAANTQELETIGQAEELLDDDILSVDPTPGPSDEPEVTTVSKPASTGPTQSSSTANTQELETIGQAEELLDDDILSVDPTPGPSDEPEVTTVSKPASTGPTQSSSTVLEDSQVTSMPASTLDPTPIPEATTSTEPDDTDNNTDRVTTSPPSSLADLEDPSISVSPEGTTDLPEPDALTTHIPSSTDAVQHDTTEEVTQGITTAHPQNVTPDPTKPATSEVTSKPQDQPDPYKPLPDKPTLVKPSSKPEIKPLEPAQTLNTDDARDYQADDSNDTNLCSGRPLGAVTTLSNGTMVVFRGHYFWTLNKYMVAGPARGITQVWGVPSPIDTAFTRCNCQGKTYIFKGSQYWRFENDVLDANYPKAIKAGFDGLRGQITAALSVPQFQRRRESVYFFKRGGLVQKYSYQYGTSSTCGRKAQAAVYTVRTRMVRQAVPVLGAAVSIRTSWRGFPSTITAAVSVPSIRDPERYKYYVLSRSKSYNVRMGSGRPVISAPPANASPQSNDFLKCPARV